MVSSEAGWRKIVLHPRRLSIALALGAIDGADIGSMGLALSRMSRDLALTAQQAGAAASASLVGLLIGALAGGRLADHIGRGPVLAGSALLLGLFSLLTAHVESFEMLVVARVLAGIGIGGVFPVVIAIAHDSVAPAWRSTAVGVVMASGPLGAAGMAFVAMVPDWRVIFYVGGAIPLLLIPFALMTNFGSTSREAKVAVAPLRAILFGGGRITGTLIIWSIAVIVVLANYLLINWLPSLLVMQGLSENASHLGAAFYSTGGIAGNLLAGIAVDRQRPALAYIVAFAGAIAVMIGFALLSGSGALMALAFLAAFFIIGGQLITFALAAGLYDDASRTTGIGVMVSVGRLGSIAGPLLAGQLLHLGFDATTVLLALTPLFFVALLLGLRLVRQLRRHGETEPHLAHA